MQPGTRTCQNCKSQFVIDPEDFTFCERIKVPAPTWCPQCRFQRRILFRNERKLFWNKSAKTGTPMLSIYPPDSGMKVLDEAEWWSDEWDPMAAGRDHDFNRTFFEQFFELSRALPVYSRDVINMASSDYCANAGSLKNCYLLFNSNHSEDSAYGNANDDCKACFDNSHLRKSERCYNSFWLMNCYRTHFSSQCEECSDVWFSKNCRGCSDCFGCVNLRNKKYCIWNVEYLKEEYERRIAEMRLDAWSGIAKAKETAQRFWQAFPVKFMQGVKNTDVTGEYVNNSRNVHHGYLVREGENLKYVQYQQVPSNKDCYDITIWGENNQLGYENCVCGIGTFNVKFCYSCWPEVRDLEYCMFCKSSANLFGCFGLRKKEYCILNKQYTKGEYASLREKIVTHMSDMPYTDPQGRVFRYGEFFPYLLSPYAYNQTITNEHFPLTKEQATAAGYRWQDPEAREYEITMRADELPDSINDVSDDVLKSVIQCGQCKRAYRLIPPELAFLKAEHIPLPRFCVDCRHNERIAQRNRSKLHHRQCMCDYNAYANSVRHEHHPTGRCPNEFETAFPPEKPEIVYCEQCYNTEVA